MKFDTRNTVLLLALVVALLFGYRVMTTPEHRTPGQKIDAAVEQLDNGVDNAARELQDRTPAERLKDDDLCSNSATRVASRECLDFESRIDNSLITLSSS